MSKKIISHEDIERSSFRNMDEHKNNRSQDKSQRSNMDESQVSNMQSNQIMIEMLQSNLQRFTRFEETQNTLTEILKDMRKDMQQLQTEVNTIKHHSFKLQPAEKWLFFKQKLTYI